MGGEATNAVDLCLVTSRSRLMAPWVTYSAYEKHQISAQRKVSLLLVSSIAKLRCDLPFEKFAGETVDCPRRVLFLMENMEGGLPPAF